MTFDEYDNVNFILDEFLAGDEKCISAAQHPHASRVIECLLEMNQDQSCQVKVKVGEMLGRLLDKIVDLSTHKIGNRVLRTVMMTHRPEIRLQILVSLKFHVEALANDRYGFLIVKKAFDISDSDQALLLIDNFLGEDIPLERLERVVENQFAVNVLKQLFCTLGTVRNASVTKKGGGYGHCPHIEARQLVLAARVQTMDPGALQRLKWSGRTMKNLVDWVGTGTVSNVP